jgi:hypothetical protein
VNSVCLWSQEGARLKECGVKTEPQRWLAGHQAQDNRGTLPRLHALTHTRKWASPKRCRSASPFEPRRGRLALGPDRGPAVRQRGRACRKVLRIGPGEHQEGPHWEWSESTREVEQATCAAPNGPEPNYYARGAPTAYQCNSDVFDLLVREIRNLK